MNINFLPNFLKISFCLIFIFSFSERQCKHSIYNNGMTFILKINLHFKKQLFSPIP